MENITKGEKKKEKDKKENINGFTEVVAVNKKSPGRRKKTDKIAPEEMSEKLHILFGGLAKLFEFEYPYSPADFEQESRALVRLSEKVPILTSIVLLFDPVLVILGLYFKWVNMRKKEGKGNVANAENNFTGVWQTFSVLRGNREREDVSGKQDDKAL